MVLPPVAPKKAMVGLGEDILRVVLGVFPCVFEKNSCREWNNRAGILGMVIYIE